MLPGADLNEESGEWCCASPAFTTGLASQPDIPFCSVITFPCHQHHYAHILQLAVFGLFMYIFHCACMQEHDILVFSSLMLFSFAICKICSIWLYSIRITSLIYYSIIYITWYCWQKSHPHVWRKPLHCTHPCCSLHSCSR